MTTGKHVPLAEVSRLREQRRKLQAKVALLEAEKEGWLVERADHEGRNYKANCKVGRGQSDKFLMV